MEKKVYAGVDVGFGSVKVVYRTNHLRNKFQFPSIQASFSTLPKSIISPSVDEQLGLKRFDLTQKYYFKIGHSFIFVGDGVTYETKRDQTFGATKPISEYLMLIIASIGIVGGELNADKLELYLTIGTPLGMTEVKSFESVKEQIESLKGITVGRLGETEKFVEFSFPSGIEIIEQGRGALLSALDFSISEDGEAYVDQKAYELLKSNVLIFDIGTNTVNVLFMENNSLDENLSGSYFNKGSLPILKRVSSYLKSKHGVIVGTATIQEILKNGIKKVRDIDIEPLLNEIVKEEWEKNTYTFLEQKLSEIRGEKDISSIIFTGGGVKLFERFIEEKFQDAILMNDPVFANADGYERFSENIGLK